MEKSVVIFGATGGTGQELIEQSLAKGYYTIAFTRNSKKLSIKNQKLRIVEGNVLHYQDVLFAIGQVDAVFCCLGKPASDRTNLRSNGTANILKAMEEKGVRRLICQSSLGFGDSKEVLPWHMKYLIVPLILKSAFKDHESQETLIENSRLDWTVVRPGNLTNQEKTGIYKHGFPPTEKIKLRISRADVAEFMLDQINSDKYLRKKAGISY